MNAPDRDFVAFVQHQLADPPGMRPTALAESLSRVATTPQRHRPRWPTPPVDRPGRLSGATRFLAAAVIVALFGGFLLIAQPFYRAPTTGPGAANEDALVAGARSPSPAPPNEPGVIDLAPGTVLQVGGWGFEIPTSGWFIDMWDPPGGPFSGAGREWIEKGPIVETTAGSRRPTAPSARIRFRRSIPDGTYADPCSRVKAEPFDRATREIDAGYDLSQQRLDLAAAVAAIPGVEVVEAPSEVPLPTSQGGYRAAHVTIAVPESACGGRGDVSLWYDWDELFGQVTDPGSTIRVWIIDNTHIGPQRLWIEAETPLDVSPELDAEIQQIVDSIGHPG